MSGSHERRNIHLSLILSIIVLLAACAAEPEVDEAGADGEASPQDTSEPASPEEATEEETAEETTTEETPGDQNGPPEGEEPVTLEAYIAFVEPEVLELAEAFSSRVNEASEGLIEVEVVADTSSIQPFESFDPLSRGVVDLAVTSTVYFSDQVPEPMIDMAVTGPESEVFRETGALELFNEALGDHNVHMLGWTGSGEHFYLIGSARLESADLSGLNVRTFPAINNFVLSLNGSPVSVPFPDVYSALERGVVDLAVTPINSIRQERLYEVSEYLIYPGFLEVRDTLLLNGDVWEGLSEWKQDILETVVVEHEEFARANRQAAAEESEELILEHVEAVELPPEEAAKVTEAARESTWDFMVEIAQDPDVAERLRELLGDLE